MKEKTQIASIKVNAEMIEKSIVMDLNAENMGADMADNHDIVLERVMEEKRDTEQFLRMIAPKYMGVYVLDRKTDFFRDIVGPDYFRKIVKEKDGHYSEALNIYKEKFVLKEDRHVIERVLDYDRVYESIWSGNDVNVSYRKTDGTLVRLKVGQYSDRDDEKNLTLWIYADEGIEYRRQLGVDNSASNILHSTMTTGLWCIEYNEKGEQKRCTWSDAFRKLLGYESQIDMPDTWNSWIEKIHPDDRATVEEKYNEAENDYSGKASYDIEYRMCNKQGEYHWFRDTAHFSRGTDGTPICTNGIIMLVDEKHETNEKLREALKNEQRQRKLMEQYQKQCEEQLSIFNSLADAYSNVLLIDLDNSRLKVLKVDGMVKYIFDKDEDEFYDYDDIQKKYLLQRVCSEDRNMMREAISCETVKRKLLEVDEYTGNYRVIEGRKLHYYQYKFVRAENINYVVAGFQNVDGITKEIQQRQAQTEALCIDYTAVFQCDLLKDTMTAVKIKEVSHSYRDNAEKYSFSEWIRYSFENIIVADTAQGFLETFDRNNLMNYFSENDSLIARHRTKPNGAGMEYFEVRVVPVYKNETSFQVMLAYRPIDEIVENEKKQQEQLSIALAAAEQSSRAKTTFLNSMSHDIRTPMNAIIGFTALAQTHINDKALVEDYLSKINTSSTHLLSLINDILDMSRIESGSVKLDEKPIHIPDLLHDLRTMIQGLVSSKQQNLYIDTQDVENEDIMADKLRLNQVLLNIVSNAIKFTPVGGDIIIRLIEKPYSAKGYTTYEFSIKDNGIGMSEDFVEHVFDTFARERSSTVSGIQGTGLGMAITKNIVDMMGGKIDVESEEGKGSKFTVTINVQVVNKPVKYEPIPELRGARALVVDDDINTCRSVCKMLRNIDMRPDWTAFGKEAILRAQDAAEIHDEYKVYIVDYLMPDMNGIETVRRIRKVIGDDIPIIVLTAYDWSDFEREAREAGVTAFVAKPIFMSELRKVLTRPSEQYITYDNKQIEEADSYDYSGKRVLLVEDNKLNREIATAILEETGMIIDVAEDGIEAVSIINKEPEGKYDLILMDIQMPRMDGYTATREIRTLSNNRKANIPIVAMTANAFDEDRRKAFETGMNGHIVKPVEMKNIAKTLDKIFTDKQKDKQ